MSDMMSLPATEWASLQERARKLAEDKAHLQLTIHLMNKLSAVSGLDNMIATMLQSVSGVIGGTNLSLYYRLGDVLHYADVYGQRRKLDGITAPDVKTVWETRQPIEVAHEFSDTRMLTPEFSKAYTWVFPLLVGAELIGVCRFENLHVSMRELSQQLPTFFSYAALVFKNEIQEDTQLKQAYDALAQEVVVRQQAEEELRVANEVLEDRVAARTAELQRANDLLLQNEQQIRLLLDKSEQSRCALLSILEDERQLETALRDERALLSRIMETSPVGIVLADRDGRITFANPQAERVLGLTKDEITQRAYNAPAWRITDYDGQSLPEERLPFRQVLSARQPVYDVQHAIVWPDGQRVFLSVNGAPILTAADEVASVVFTVEDITARKRAEARILRLNRLYATLSQINETIAHVRDREALFHEICRVAVVHGQFCLAWISLVDEATNRVQPVAFAGEEQGYLTAITITYADEVLGRGPTGTAIREGRCVLCQDIATDARMLPWREQALPRGYRSTATVPIWQHGRVIGALTVYAAEPQSFDAEDEALLDEIGLDISFALDALEQEAQRRQAENELARLNAELEQRVIERTAELARAHEHLRAILDTAGEGVVFTDVQGTIEYINPAMERLTGYQAHEAIGRNPRMWKSDQTPATTFHHMWSALAGGEIWQGELINRRKGGTRYDAALTIAPLTNPEGQIVGFVGIQRDITRQKELDRLKDQFVSNVSHELRTPLTNILLHAELLDHGKADRHASYLQTLCREAERLRNLIEDLLDLSRLDRNVASIQLAPIDLQQLLAQLVNDRVALAEQRGLTLAFTPTPELPLVLTDASQLIQVASNLLTNALNYTPTGGAVSVRAEVRRAAEQNLVAFTVRDTGPGISAQDLPHLFERFYRGAAGRQASAPGTGLGLAISQEIMTRLNGYITVESEVGHGAAFTVWLPRA